MWDLPGSRLEPVSPALAGGFLTTAPPGKSQQRGPILIINYEQQAYFWPHFITEVTKLHALNNIAPTRGRNSSLRKVQRNAVVGAFNTLNVPIEKYGRWYVPALSLKNKMINKHMKKNLGASLVAQWLRICLPMQGTRVRALVREDPTCCGATKPMRHNYWACATGACAPQRERPR